MIDPTQARIPLEQFAVVRRRIPKRPVATVIDINSRRRQKPAAAKPDFIQLPMSMVEDPKLDDREQRVLLAVLSAAWVVEGQTERNPCTLRLKEIGRRAGGKGATQTREILQSLVERGILTATPRQGQPTEYRFVDPLGYPHPTPSEIRGGTPSEIRTRSRRSEVEKGSSTSLTPAQRGNKNQKPGGGKLNPRAVGTNPRAIADAWNAAIDENEERDRVKWVAEMEALDPDPEPERDDPAHGGWVERNGREHDYPYPLTSYYRGMMERLIRRSMTGKSTKWRPEPNQQRHWKWIAYRVRQILEGKPEMTVTIEELFLLLKGDGSPPEP